MTINVAVNRQIRGKADPTDKSAMISLTYEYDVESLTCEEFAKEIEAGHSFTSVFLDPDGKFHRKSEFFVSADVFAVDMDNMDPESYMSFDDALADPFIRENAFLLYTTPSNTEDHNKFRIVFRPAAPITDADEYRKVVSSFIEYFGADPSCKDAGRFFYGSGEGGQVITLDNTISNKELKNIAMKKKENEMKEQRNNHQVNSMDTSTIKMIAEAKIKRHLDELSDSVEGERNTQLNRISFMVAAILAGAKDRDVVLDEEFYLDRLEKIGLELGLDVQEVNNTISSGFFDGLEEPFNLVEAELNSIEQIKEFNRDDESTFDPYIEAAKDYEVGLGRLFTLENGDRLIFNSSQKEWMRYENGIWKVDTNNKTFKEIPDTLSENFKIIRNYYKSVMELSKERASKDDLAKMKLKIKNCNTALSILGKVRQVKQISTYASWSLSKEVHCFDSKPLLLNMKNGTYDLNEMEFRGHRGDDYLTRLMPVKHDPNAQCPKWNDFLNQIFQNNMELISFMKRLIGYSLTGLTNEQYLFFAYGTGANGKTTFFKVLEKLLSEYFKPLSIDTLLHKQSSNTTEYQLASIKGARMVLTTEIPTYAPLNESIVKQLTGGEAIACREIYSKPYSYEPTFKLFMCGNHKPKVRGNDEGIWRRIMLIPFLYTIPKDRRRKMDELISELVSELPGILNWALDGYSDYISKGGLVPPALVNDAVEEYRQDCEILSEFMADMLEKAPGHKELLVDITNEELNYYKNKNQEPPISGSKSMKLYLIEKGYRVEKGTGNKQYVKGIKLVKEPRKLGNRKEKVYTWGEHYKNLNDYGDDKMNN